MNLDMFLLHNASLQGKVQEELVIFPACITLSSPTGTGQAK
jgi:hypothetical protein